MKKKKYGCVMLFLDFPQMETLHKVIDNNDVFDNDENEYGLETEPHVTLLYGLHDDIPDDEIINSIKDITFNEITVGNISSFNNEEYDVLKFDVESSSLNDANSVLTKFPHTTDYPDYHPHMTVGYLKKGTSAPYIKDLNYSKFKLIPNYGVFSKANGEKLKFSIKNKD